MKKKELIVKLDELLTLEEGKQPLVQKHVPATLPFSGLKESEYLAIQKEMEQLTQTGEKHIETLKNLKEQVLKSGQEGY
jgi:hypothetical protein